MRLYIIRHADPDYANHTITPAGHLEAKALADRLARQGLDRVYYSPMGRSVDTMRYAAEVLSCPFILAPWAQEIANYRIDTPMGSMAAWDTPGELVRGGAKLPTAQDWYKTPLFSAPVLLEKFRELQGNSDAFFYELGYVREGGRYRIMQPNRLKVGIFTHGGFGVSWLAHLLELPLPLMWSGFWLPPSSVTTILFDERSKDWAVPRCLSAGDVSHLYQAGLPVQPAGISANFE